LSARSTRGGEDAHPDGNGVGGGLDRQQGHRVWELLRPGTGGLGGVGDQLLLDLPDVGYLADGGQPLAVQAHDGVAGGAKLVG
jgi:hypothetical protein